MKPIRRALPRILKQPARKILDSTAQGLSNAVDYSRFLMQYFSYKNKAEPNESIELWPCLGEWQSCTRIEPIYFYQDCWAFDLIAKARPNRHIDIGSHHKYVALLSKVVPVTMVDIRPLSLEMDSIHFLEGSILNLPFPDESLSSLSSLCVIEHIGLGRYGDPLNPNGSIEACREICRVIEPGGSIYVSVPIEHYAKTYFNAHRSFTEEQFLSLFPGFTLQDQAFIYGSRFSREREAAEGVGCFHLMKDNAGSAP